jgi:hypothetical protein
MQDPDAVVIGHDFEDFGHFPDGFFLDLLLG